MARLISSTASFVLVADTGNKVGVSIIVLLLKDKKSKVVAGEGSSVLYVDFL